VVFGDSISAYRVSSSLHPEALRALTTIAGAEPLCMAEVADLGLISPSPDPATDETARQFRLDGVQALWLSRSDVTNAVLEHTGAAPRLRKLHLRGTRVTDAGVQELQKLLPHCGIQLQH
jgi:hypothetical protein